MTNIRNIFYCIIAASISASMFSGCSKWTEPKPIAVEVNPTSISNPQAWNEYTARLKAYKSGNHYLAYARFENGAQKPVNEGNYLRSLPDSLDIVSVANFDVLSENDKQDIACLHEKGTKVLMLVDFAKKSAELSSQTELSAYLDKVLATGKELSLDGYSFTGIALFGGSESEISARKQAASTIVSKLSADKGKILVFEGDPAFVAAEDLSKLNYVVLDTEKAKDITSFYLKVSHIRETTGLPYDKLLVATFPDKEITDENQLKYNSLELLGDRLLDLGPIAGIAVYDIGRDYFNPTMNYFGTRRLITLMNISK